MAATFINRSSLKLTRGATLSSQIVTEIRSAVFEGRLAPGSFLGSENELAKRFGVSRITVRDALRSLSATGLVEIRQGAGGGARIAKSNLDYFADALAVQFQLAGVGVEETLRTQSAIEGTAAELAAGHRAEEDLERLADALEHAAKVAHDPAAFTEASLGFHLAVAEASHNRALIALLRALRYIVWPNENKRATAEVAARVDKTHREIFARIEARDGAGARDAMTKHLGGIRVSKQKQHAEVFC